MYNESDSIALINYNPEAKFCRNPFKNGRVRIFIHESIRFINVSLIKFSKEKDLEIRAVILHLSAYTICIVAIYRSLSGNFQYFLNNFETILNLIYSNSIEIIICGDINVNYLNDSTHNY
jgi:hypothetical protein